MAGGMIFGVATTFVLRILATVFKWNMPKAIVFSRMSDSAGAGAEGSNSDAKNG